MGEVSEKIYQKGRWCLKHIAHDQNVSLNSAQFMFRSNRTNAIAFYTLQVLNSNVN